MTYEEKAYAEEILTVLFIIAAIIAIAHGYFVIGVILSLKAILDFACAIMCWFLSNQEKKNRKTK